MKPKMGKMDIDYEVIIWQIINQVLHDAFFKYMTKSKMTDHGDM